VPVARYPQDGLSGASAFNDRLSEVDGGKTTAMPELAVKPGIEHTGQR